MFGVVFPNRSFPLDISTFSQIDTFHWVLDMNHFVGESYDQIKVMCIFLLNKYLLPPDKALAVYVQSPGSACVYCGAVTLSRPSAVLSLLWPEPGSQNQFQLPADGAPLSAKIGICVEDLASLPSLDVAADKKIEQIALKVWENLCHFCVVEGSNLIVPMDILDNWFKKFQERANQDPEYLKGATHSFLSRKMIGDASADEIAQEEQEVEDARFVDQLEREKFSKGKAPLKADEVSKVVPQRIPYGGNDTSAQPSSESERSFERIVLDLHSLRGVSTMEMKGLPTLKKKPTLDGSPTPKVISASTPRTDASGRQFPQRHFSVFTPRGEGSSNFLAMDISDQMMLVDQWVRFTGVVVDPSPSIREAERVIVKGVTEMLQHTHGLPDLDRLYEELKSLKAGKIFLKEKVKRLRSEREFFKTKLAATDQRITELESELNLSQASLEEVKQCNTKLESELDLSQATVEKVMQDLEGVKKDLSFLRSDRVLLCDRDDFWWHVICLLIKNEGIEFRPNVVREWVERVNDSWLSPGGNGGG